MIPDFKSLLSEAPLTKQNLRQIRDIKLKALWQSKAKQVAVPELQRQQRIFLPLQVPPVEVPTHIQSFMDEKGYKIDDYLEGLARDHLDRQTTIGRLLTRYIKTDPHASILLKDFNEDPQRTSSHIDRSSLRVCISNHPDDVIGMSTQKPWTSCLDLDNITGDKKDYLSSAYKVGSHVAYLVHKDDTNIENPLMRIAIHPHYSDNTSEREKHTILRPEYGYGNPIGGFAETVDKWIGDKYRMKPSHIYYKDQSVYDDVRSELNYHFDTASLTEQHISNYLKQLEKAESYKGHAYKADLFIDRLTRYGTDEAHHKLLNVLSKHLQTDTYKPNFSDERSFTQNMASRAMGNLSAITNDETIFDKMLLRPELRQLATENYFTARNIAIRGKDSHKKVLMWHDEPTIRKLVYHTTKDPQIKQTIEQQPDLGHLENNDMQLLIASHVPLHQDKKLFSS